MIVGQRTLPRTFVLVVPRLPVEEMINGYLRSATAGPAGTVNHCPVLAGRAGTLESALCPVESTIADGPPQCDARVRISGICRIRSLQRLETPVSPKS